MIVLDTTILVYAMGAEHGYRDPCRRLIKAITDGLVEATTMVEVIQEFVHVRARRRGRSDAVRLARDYADLLAPMLLVSGDALARGLDLYEQHDSLGAFDAVLAAAAIGAGAGPLVSADLAFAKVPRLSHVVPDPDGITSLLQRR